MAPSLRSRKAAGAALLGVSAAALTVGIVSAATGSGGSGSTGGQAQGSSSSAAPSTETSVGAGSTGGSSSESSSNASSAGSSSASAPTSSPGTSYPPGKTTTEVPAPGTNTPVQPPAATTTKQPGSSGGQPGAGQQLAPLRVYNNSTIKGLAARAAQDFRNAGYNVVQVGNYSQGVISSTTAYYRPGTDEQATAEKLGQRFGFGAQPRFAGIQNASPGVIVIVTNNYHG
ncbi:MAG: LytR C-terminal domain-containing protein [Sciscionella sp.]|nr:LytR C-terminal domain-containing protein [Sciscionella sp.]